MIPLFALCSALLGACAIRPNLPATIDTARYIVRPTQGCIQGVYQRYFGRRRGASYQMIGLRKHGTALAFDDASMDFAEPLLGATRDSPGAHQMATRARRLKAASAGLMAAGLPTGLGFIVAALSQSGTNSQGSMEVDAVPLGLGLTGLGLGIGSILLGISLDNEVDPTFERSLTLYNEQATAGCNDSPTTETAPNPRD